MLLGEQYFLRSGASERRASRYMARSWRRLVRLPWLRDESQIPQWLRLALLCAAVVAAGTLTAWLAGRAAAGRDAVLAVKEDW